MKKITAELNYKVDKNASNLRTQQSDSLALLLCAVPTNDDSAINPFFLSMLGSITKACADRGYDLLVSFQQASNDWHADFKDSNKADGLILLGYGDYVDFQEKLIKLNEQGTHFVRWGAEVSELPITSIGSDNFNGDQEITNHVIKQGRTKLAFLGSASFYAPDFLERYKSHCQALENNQIEVNPNLQINALYTEEAGYIAACKLIKSNQPFDSICAACNMFAIGAMRALKEHNFRIPEDVAVVGFDDIAVASFTSPPMTSVKQDTKVAGELLVESLLKSIAGGQIKTTLIPTQLIVPKSCHCSDK